MSYILNNDKSENFECTISLEGASLENSKARIIIETKDLNLMYYGTIDSDGKCTVLIENLKKPFPKEIKGIMKLEVIADDTYFSPWQDSVVIKPSKSLKVETVSVGKKKPKKPSIKVQVQRKPNIQELIGLIKKQGITKNLILKNKKKVLPKLAKIVFEYHKNLNAKPQNGILKEIISKL